MYKVGQLVCIPANEITMQSKLRNRKIPEFGKVVKVTKTTFEDGLCYIKVNFGDFNLIVSMNELKPYFLNEPESE